MSIRKNRIACQGVTNQSQMSVIANKSAPYLKIPEKTTKLTQKQFKCSNLSQAKSKYDSPNMKLTTQDQLGYQSMSNSKACQKFTANQSYGQHSQLHSRQSSNMMFYKQSASDQTNKTFILSLNEHNPKLTNTLNKLRTTYKYNTNVKRVIKAWGFQNKGCITDQQFQNVIKKHFDSSITQEDCRQLFATVSGRRNNLDVLSFIKLLFDQQPFTKPHINVLDPMNDKTIDNKQTSQTLITKIQGLNQASLYQNTDFNHNRSFVLPQINNRFEQTKKMSNSVMMDRNQTFDKTQPSLYQTLHSQSSPKFNFSTTKSQTIDFTPTMFYGKNQQKTRFGATPILQLNDQSQQQNKRQKIIDQKHKIVGQIQNKMQFQKARYQNKLQKIRQYQMKEKENIWAIDNKIESIDNANMKRIREQNLAYNYVNFLHNDWK